MFITTIEKHRQERASPQCLQAGIVNDGWSGVSAVNINQRILFFFFLTLSGAFQNRTSFQVSVAGIPHFKIQAQNCFLTICSIINYDNFSSFTVFTSLILFSHLLHQLELQNPSLCLLHKLLGTGEETTRRKISSTLH